MNEKILKEAEYCLNCLKKPCHKGCPLNNDIPLFISKIKEDNYLEAYNILTNTTVLPSICGRICSHDTQCQSNCIRSIKGPSVRIGELESFIGDIALKNNYSIPKFNKLKKSYKIAIIGSGPSSLTCAAFLARYNNQVTIYEKYNKLGGLLSFGIPDFRLPSNIVDETISQILSLGIKVKYNMELGKNISLSFLQKNYDAIYLGLGSNISNNMSIPNENINGVNNANELLEKNNHPDYQDKYIIINGGGNVAMDIARTVKRLGAKKVTIVYRRSKEEMPVSKKELEDTINEGIDFIFQTKIIKIIGNNKIAGVECLKTKQKNTNRHLVPLEIKDSNHIIKCDYLIKAIGSHPNYELLQKLKLKTNNNYLLVNENNQTSIPNIFAGGDLIGTKKTVAHAARSGRDAAMNIIKYLEEYNFKK